MTGWVHLVTRVYRVLLVFYPSGFRAEFGEEMQDLFATALTEAQYPGAEQPWRLFWGAVLFALGLAIIKELPRWSLSYLGFVLMLGITLSRYDRLWGWIYPYFIRSFGSRSYWPLPVRIIYRGIFAFITSFSILGSSTSNRDQVHH